MSLLKSRSYWKHASSATAMFFERSDPVGVAEVRVGSLSLESSRFSRTSVCLAESEITPGLGIKPPSKVLSDLFQGSAHEK
jgi:hypothetical protein